MSTAENNSSPELALKLNAAKLLDFSISRVHELFPQIREKYGEEGAKRTAEDFKYHFDYLQSAVFMQDKNIFTDYVAWVKTYFNWIKLPEVWTKQTFVIMQESVKNVLESPLSEEINSYLEYALERFDTISLNSVSFISADNKLAILANQYINTLMRKDRNTAGKLIENAIENGIPVKDIYLSVFQPAQWEIGRLWQENKISVAMEHYFTASTQFIISRLYSHIFSTEKKGYNLVATSVTDELHELGVRMVSDFFEMEGWNTVYLGANTPHSSIVQMIRETSADVLAVSATISFNLEKVSDLIQFVRKQIPSEELKIIVGGRAFNSNQELWRKINADGYAPDAQAAIELATRLIG